MTAPVPTQLTSIATEPLIGTEVTPWKIDPVMGIVPDTLARDRPALEEKLTPVFVNPNHEVDSLVHKLVLG